MKTKNTFRFTFLHAMKKFFFLPILIFLGMLLGHYSAFSQMYYEFILPAKEEAMNTGIDYTELIADAKYLFIYSSSKEWSSSSEELTLCLISCIILSALLGILLFRFVTSKKTVNVYYSLGIKRADLFTARYLAGSTMIFASVFLALLVVVFANLYFFGASAMLFKAFLFYLLHYSTVCIASFTIAATISGCIGTFLESIGFTAILLAFPTVISQCFSNICSALLHGAPTDISFYTIFGSDKSMLLSIESTPVGKILKNANLFLLNQGSFFNMGQVLDKSTAKGWKFPSLMPYVFWIVIIIAIFFLGVYLFKKRKAEICGFTGKNKLLNSTASAVISLFLISVIASPIGNPFVLALVGIIISFAVFSVIELILTRNFKDYVKTLKFFPIHAALIIVLIACFAGGFFGYSKRIPEVKDIKSVQISIPSKMIGMDDPSLYDGYDDFRYTLSQPDKTFNYFYLSSVDPFMLTPETKDENLIKTVLNIHKKIIADGFIYDENEEERLDYKNRSSFVNIAIIYNLKDGKQLVRNYKRISTSALFEFYSIEDTAFGHQYIDEHFENRDLENTIPAIFSKQMEKKNFIPEELRKDLLKALSADLKSLKKENIWTPKGEYLGAAVIYDNPKFSANGDNPRDPSMDAAYHDAGEDTTPEEMIMMGWRGPHKSYYFSLYDDAYSTVIPITENMKNTINFLKQNNLYELLIDSSPVVSARYIEANIPTAVTQNLGLSVFPLFNEFWDDGKAKPYTEKEGNYTTEYKYETGILMPKGTKTTTDKNVIDSLLKNAYGSYLDIDGTNAYIVEFERKDKTRTIMYVPSNRVIIK